MADRRCPRCETSKAEEDFPWRDKAHTRRQSYCRECQNSAWTDWYASPKNRDRHLGLVAARRRRRIARHQKLVNEQKKQPCADCGLVFPPHVMDFDHLGDKTGEISRFVYQVGTERLVQELEKCEAVCANCHRLRTHRRRLEGDSTDYTDSPDSHGA